jgi:site-specific recombinase XerD
MRILEIPTRFMFWLSTRPRSNRPNTWRAYGDDLLDFLRVCEASDWDYLSLAFGQLGAYRDHLRSRVTIRKQPMARSTINRKLGTVCRFYDWLVRIGAVDELPFVREERSISRREADLLAHVTSSRVVSDGIRLPPSPVRVPIALRTELITAICRDLAERDELIVSWALATGAREDEILSLDLGQIPDTQSRGNFSKKIVEVYITKTKGLKPRLLFVPRGLLDRTNRYIAGTRSKIIALQKLRGRPMTSDALRAVFLSRRGARLSARRIQAVFRTAADRAGSSARFHDLRHTFAIHRLIQLRDAAQEKRFAFDPLKTLKEILGHRSVATVYIYLEALDIDPSIAEDALIDWVSAWTPAA